MGFSMFQRFLFASPKTYVPLSKRSNSVFCCYLQRMGHLAYSQAFVFHLRKGCDTNSGFSAGPKKSRRIDRGEIASIDSFASARDSCAFSRFLLEASRRRGGGVSLRTRAVAPSWSCCLVFCGFCRGIAKGKPTTILLLGGVPKETPLSLHIYICIIWGAGVFRKTRHTHTHVATGSE